MQSQNQGIFGPGKTGYNSVRCHDLITIPCFDVFEFCGIMAALTQARSEDRAHVHSDRIADITEGPSRAKLQTLQQL